VAVEALERVVPARNRTSYLICLNRYPKAWSRTTLALRIYQITDTKKGY